MAPRVTSKKRVSEDSSDSSKIVKKSKNLIDEDSDISLPSSSDEEEIDEDEEGSVVVGEPGSSDNHTEQRKLLKERKLKRSSGSEIQQIKILWEQLRTTNPPIPKFKKEKLCDEIWKLSSNNIGDFIMKHDASRIIQTLIKFANKELKLKIVKSLTGKYYNLATSSYGKYLLIKLLHYGNKESNQIIINELSGNFTKLIKHREGAYVLEDLFILYSTKEQKLQILKEFWGKEFSIFKNDYQKLTINEICDENADKKLTISRNLLTIITSSINKGSTGFEILHYILNDFVTIMDDKQFEELFELLNEQFAELVHTDMGSRVLSIIIAKSNAKQRKSIIKNLKKHFIKLVENEYGYLVFITLLECVDDTVLIFKTFSPMITENFIELTVNKYSRKILLFLMNGYDSKYFSPITIKQLNYYIELSKLTSKKDSKIRHDELLNKFSLIFFKNINKNLNDFFNDNLSIQFLNEFLINEELYKINSDAFLKIINKLIELLFEKPLIDGSNMVHMPFTTRLIKSLIQAGKWDNKEKKIKLFKELNDEIIGKKFAIDILNKLKEEGNDDGNNLIDWINDKDTSFIIVALYDKLKDDKKVNIKKLIKVSDINDKDADNKGSILLKKLLK